MASYDFQKSHLLGQQAVKHERSATFRFNDINHEKVYDTVNIGKNLDKLKNLRMKQQLYGKNASKYMGETLQVDLDDNRNAYDRVDNTTQMMSQSRFSPLQRTGYLSNKNDSPWAHSMKQSLTEKKPRYKSSFRETGLQSIREGPSSVGLKHFTRQLEQTNERRDKIFLRIAQKTMERPEKVKMMYALQEGPTQASQKYLQGYTNDLAAYRNSRSPSLEQLPNIGVSLPSLSNHKNSMPIANTRQPSPSPPEHRMIAKEEFDKIKDQIMMERKKRLGIETELRSLIESTRRSKAELESIYSFE